MDEKPNVLFFFPDQHRGDWLPYPSEIAQLYGMDALPLKTPNIQKLMKNGVTFTRTVTPSPLCAPARACLASGLRYKYCRVMDNTVNYDKSLPTFYSALQDNGYEVAGVGKLDLHKPDLFWGLDGWLPLLGELGFTQAVDTEGKWDGIWSLMKQKGERPKHPNGAYHNFLKERDLLETHFEDME